MTFWKNDRHMRGWLLRRVALRLAGWLADAIAIVGFGVLFVFLSFALGNGRLASTSRGRADEHVHRFHLGYAHVAAEEAVLRVRIVGEIQRGAAACGSSSATVAALLLAEKRAKERGESSLADPAPEAPINRPAPSVKPAGWYRDPSSKFDYRWFDGGWTESVANEGDDNTYVDRQHGAASRSSETMSR